MEGEVKRWDFSPGLLGVDPDVSEVPRSVRGDGFRWGRRWDGV